MSANRLESRLLATAAMGLALAVTAPYRDAEAADICGVGTTTITTAQANSDNCTLNAGESVDVQAAGSIPFTGADPAIEVANGVSAGSIANAGTVSVTAAGEEAIVIRTNGSLTSGIVNTGTVSSATSHGIDIVSSGSIDANGITNAAGASITGQIVGILVNAGSSITGGIDNAGAITGTTDIGVKFSVGTTLAGGITNASGATITGAAFGIALESSASVTSGGITNAGTINAVGDGIGINNLSSVTGDLTNAAGGLIDSGDDGIFLTNGTLTGNLVNAGTIDADGDGIFVDTSSTITGSIQNSGSITGGTNGIHVDDSGVDGITNAAGATITGGTFSILIAGPDAPITVTNAGTLVGEVQLNDGTLELNGSSARVDGVISGLASSTVNVNGAFTTEGDVDVGTLNVASSAELTLDNDIDVDSGFTNAGTVAIADGATRTVTGDYTQTGNGTLQIGATSDSSFGKLVTTGTVDLSAADALHVIVGAGASLATGDQLGEVIASGSLNASGLTITDSSALLVFEGLIDDTTIDLKVSSRRSIETIVEDAGGNGGGAGGALDDIIADGASGDMQNVIDALNALGTDEEIEGAVKKLLPAITGGHAQVNVAAAQAGATNVVQDRLIRLSGLNAGDDLFAEPAAWIKPFAADTAQGSRGGVSGYDGLTVGAAVGLDARLTDDVRAGLAVSYADATIDGRGASDSSVDLDTIQVTAYGTYDIDPKTHLNVIGAFGWNDNESRRVIDFGGLDRTAEADYDSFHGIADIELVRRYKLSESLGLMPSLAATYTYAYAEDYSETGADAANLDVDDADADSLTFAAAGKLIYETEPGVNVTGNLGLSYDVLAGDDQVTATFEGGGGAFVTESIDPAPFGVTAGVGLELVPATGIDVSLNYDIEAREDFRNHKVQLNFRLPF